MWGKITLYCTDVVKKFSLNIKGVIPIIIKILCALLSLFMIYEGYSILKSAAEAILMGNVSKSAYKKITKDLSLIEKIKLNYIIPHAKLYLSSLKAIIVFSRFYIFLFFVEFIFAVWLIILNIGTMDWIILFIVNLILTAPVYIFQFIASYPGWSKTKGHRWRYEVDGKESRKSNK